MPGSLRFFIVIICEIYQLKNNVVVCEIYQLKNKNHTLYFVCSFFIFWLKKKKGGLWCGLINPMTHYGNG